MECGFGRRFAPLLGQQCLQRGRPRADLPKPERTRRPRQRMGDTNQRIAGGQGVELTCNGLQLRELIGASDKETLPERGERIV